MAETFVTKEKVENYFQLLVDHYQHLQKLENDFYDHSSNWQRRLSETFSDAEELKGEYLQASNGIEDEFLQTQIAFTSEDYVLAWGYLKGMEKRLENMGMYWMDYTKAMGSPFYKRQPTHPISLQGQIKKAQDILSQPEDSSEKNVSWGVFFLESELAQEKKSVPKWHQDSVIAGWSRYLDEVRFVATGSGKEKLQLELAVEKIFIDNLQLYIRKNARLLDVIEGNGGNCVAQTKLVIAAFHDLKIKLDGDAVLAVQVFQDHVRPIIYFPSKNKVLDLVYGEYEKGVGAPLYNPRILFHSFLSKQGASLPNIRMEDLLMADADKDHNKQEKNVDSIILTNSDLTFPSGKNVFNAEPVPERAIIRSQRQKNGTVQPSGYYHHDAPLRVEGNGGINNDDGCYDNCIGGWERKRKILLDLARMEMKFQRYQRAVNIVDCICGHNVGLIRSYFEEEMIQVEAYARLGDIWSAEKILKHYTGNDIISHWSEYSKTESRFRDLLDEFKRVQKIVEGAKKNH